MNEQLTDAQAQLRLALEQELDQRQLREEPWLDDIQTLLMAPGKLLSLHDPSLRIPAGYCALLPFFISRYCAPPLFSDSASLSSVALACELLFCALDYFDEIEDNDQSPARSLLGDGRLLNSATRVFIAAFSLLTSNRPARDAEQLRLIVDRQLAFAMRGQHRDIRTESLPLASFDTEDSLIIAREKSGSLFGMISQLAACSVHASDEIVHLLSELGMLLGTAFQLKNDAHDLEVLLASSDGEIQAFQKSDLERGKKTLPLVLAGQQYSLQKSSPSVDRKGQGEQEQIWLRQAYQNSIAATVGSATFYRLQVKEYAEKVEEVQKKSMDPALRFLLDIDTL
jgi:geranylgeranyl pyrophosphate synthase